VPRPWLAPLKKGGKFSSVGKNPTVKTHFLPDRDREIHEREEREKLKAEFITTQKVRPVRHRSNDVCLNRKCVCVNRRRSSLKYMEKSDWMTKNGVLVLQTVRVGCFEICFHTFDNPRFLSKMPPCDNSGIFWRPRNCSKRTSTHVL